MSTTYSPDSHTPAVRYGWCLQPNHRAAECPERKFGHTRADIIDDDPTEDGVLTGALARRMIDYRTYAGQLTRLIREAGLTIPPNIAALDPDHRFPPYTP